MNALFICLHLPGWVASLFACINSTSQESSIARLSAHGLGYSQRSESSSNAWHADSGQR
jgi:hypothetical protein